jgi:hypothetical protein
MSARKTGSARVGFVIGDQLREVRILHPDRPGGGAQGLMRFGWIAAEVNRNTDGGLRYELYRPWRRYDALVFVKAMGGRNATLRDRYREAGRATIADVNVNYFEGGGRYYYEGMETTGTQRGQAVDMVHGCDGVIADSSYLAAICREYNPRTRWIPDNVNMALVPPHQPWRPDGGRLPLVWSGQAHKLFELLAIEDSLRLFRDRVRLVLVTNDLSGCGRWFKPYRDRFRTLMDIVPNEIIPFESVEQLWRVYAGTGGVCISPRFLDNPYNMGHTEWKIALGMACGRVAVCSPVPSYVDVASTAQGRGIRVCAAPEDWSRVFDDILSGRIDFGAEEAAARSVIERHYATTVVALRHAESVKEILAFRHGGAS